jgi:replicative DNA helicase
MTRTIPAPQEQELPPLPENLDAERYILGACLTSKDALADAMETLEASHFSLEKHRRIWICMSELAAMGFGIDRVTLAHSLRERGELESVDGLSYIVSLDDGLPVAFAIKDYIRIVKQKASLRTIIRIGQDLINQANDGYADPVEIVSRLDERVYTTFRTSEISKIQVIGDFIASQPINELLNPKSVAGLGIYTGYARLDEITDGLHESEIWVIGAGTGVGKTSIALQVALHNAEKGIPVLIFSLEMTKKALFVRLVCQRAEVSIIRFRGGDLSEKERNRVMEATDHVRQLPIYFDESPRLRASDIAIRTKRAKEQYGIKLACLDYLQKVKPSIKGNRQEQLSDICESFIEIAKETVPWLILSQLSREFVKDKRKPNLSDLRESGAIEQMSHVVVLPYREELYNKKKDTDLKGKAEFILAKQRDGETEDIPMQFIGWRLMYLDAPSHTGTLYD